MGSHRLLLPPCGNDDDLAILTGPEWITNAIYIWLTSDRVMANDGIVWRSTIETVLKNPSGGTAPKIDHYEPDECEYIHEVMRKFDLSYKSQDHQLRWWFELAPPRRCCDSA